MHDLPHSLEHIERLRKHAFLGKHKHFRAANRCKKRHASLGVPAVLINLIIGSILFSIITEDAPEFAKYSGAVLALIAACLSAIQTYFNFQKSSDGHRAIGNRYIAIERKCEHLMALYCDELISLTELGTEMEKLEATYQEINQEGEAFPTNQKDYSFALSRGEEKSKLEPSLVERCRPDEES